MVEEDGSVIIKLTGSDPDEQLDVLSYEIVTPPSHGSVKIIGDQLTYMPAADYAGDDSFTYRAYDGRYYSEPASVGLTVNAVPDLPIVELTVSEFAGVGFYLPLTVTVFDPDEGADHEIVIIWDDGSDERSGEVLVNGVVATGPIYSIGLNGYGNLNTSHAYTRAGSYNIFVCAVDKGITTAASTGCNEVKVTVEPRVAYRMSATASAEEVRPGDTVAYSLVLENKLFDLMPEDGTQGLADSNVVLTGLVSPGLNGLRHPAISAAACTFNNDSFRCELGNMPFDSSQEVKLEADVDNLAPGLALLSLSAEVSGTAPLHQPVAGGAQVKVIAADVPPQLVSLTPEKGETEIGTQVTLSGSDFQSGAAVYFGNRLAKITEVMDAETIIAQAPTQSAGAVDVVVINPDARSDKLALAFTYEKPAEVVVQEEGGGNGGGGGSLGLSLLGILMALLFMSRRLS